VRSSLCSALILRLPVGVSARRQIAADLIAKRIDFPIGVGERPGRDREGRNELRQPGQEADIDKAEYLRGYELIGIIGKQKISEIPEENSNPEREDETALGCFQPLKWAGFASSRDLRQ